MVEPRSYTGTAIFRTAPVRKAVTLFWSNGEVHVIDAEGGRIVFWENVASGTHHVGQALVDSDLNETIASSAQEVVTGLGRNTFTATCTYRHFGVFDPIRASFTLTVRDAAGIPHSDSVILDRADTKTLSVSFVAEEAGEGAFRISAMSIR